MKDDAGAAIAELVAGGISTEELEGVLTLLQPAPSSPPPELTYPPAIGFLLHAGPRKSGKCLYCGSKDSDVFSGDGVKWQLCKTHAILAAEWALNNLAALREHREVAAADLAVAKRGRIVAKLQAALQAGNERSCGLEVGVDSVSDATPATARPLDALCEPSPSPGGEDAPMCVGGASEPPTAPAVTE